MYTLTPTSKVAPGAVDLSKIEKQITALADHRKRMMAARNLLTTQGRKFWDEWGTQFKPMVLATTLVMPPRYQSPAAAVPRLVRNELLLARVDRPVPADRIGAWRSRIWVAALAMTTWPRSEPSRSPTSWVMTASPARRLRALFARRDRNLAPSPSRSNVHVASVERAPPHTIQCRRKKGPAFRPAL